MLFFFPHLHPELASAAVEVRFLDPGMAETDDDRFFKPTDLPMESAMAKSLVQDSVNFGEQFKDPGEMAYFGAQTASDYYEGSSMSIQAQLSRQFDDGAGSKEERMRKEAMSKAQFILALAWTFEERILELRDIEAGVKRSWDDMDADLGVDDEDRLEVGTVLAGNAVSHTGGVSDEQAVPLPWKRVIEAMAAFLPEDAVLLCADPEIIESWTEWDIAFGPAEAGLGLPEGARVAAAPAWALAGRRIPPADLPHALRELTVAVIG